MKKNIKNSLLYILACGILCANSCGSRSEDEPVVVNPADAPAGTLIDVNIGLPTTGYTETDTKANTYAQITEDNVTSAVEVERIIDPSDDYQLRNGVHYKVVAYKKIDNKYIFQKSNDFVVGDNNKISLNKSQNYTVIIYSLDTYDVLPDLDNQQEFDNAFFKINSADEKSTPILMYQRIDDFIPDGKNNLNIKLEPKISKIRFTIDASDFYGGNNAGVITNLKDVKLSYSKYRDAKLKISDKSNQLIFNGDDIKTLDISNFSSDSNKKASEWINLPVNTSKNAGNIKLNAEITVDGIKSDIPYKIDINNVKSGLKQNINLKLELCGLKTERRGWKQFMCHDLGADYSANPFKGDIKLHGARYQWAGVMYVSAEEDLFHPVIDSWDKTTIKPNNTEEEAIWGGKNPCPENYRILDSDDLGELSRRKFRKAGNWDSSDLNRGFELDDNQYGKLFFPTTGFRDTNGKLFNLGEETNLWARREDYQESEKVKVLRISKDANDRINTNVSAQSKKMGFTVRCVKKSIFDY